jgi:hypothetical protein
MGQALENSEEKFMSENQRAWDRFRAGEISPSHFAGQHRGFDYVGL